MFDPRRSLVWACGLLLAWAEVARPQHDSAVRRVRQLDSLLADRLASAAALTRATRRDQGYVNVTSGPFTVRTAPAVSSTVQQAVAIAYAEVAQRGGQALTAALLTHVPLFVADSTHTRLGVLPVYQLNADTAPDRVRGRSERLYGPLRVRDLAYRLASFASTFAWQSADSSLSAWLGIQSIPLREASRDQWSDAYVEYATVASVAGRGCRRGVAESCLIALGLGDLPSSLGAWYAAEDHRALVRHTAPPHGDSAAVAAWMDCSATAKPESCAQAVLAIPSSRLPAPFASALRSLLLDETLRAGGPGAFDRLLAARGRVRDRLAAAAGIPVERLADRWRARLIAARPHSTRVGPVLLFASLGWSALLLSVALARRGSWS
jgi:hypothetical protein